MAEHAGFPKVIRCLGRSIASCTYSVREKWTASGDPSCDLFWLHLVREEIPRSSSGLTAIWRGGRAHFFNDCAHVQERVSGGQ